jgi:hypothetical protein
MALVRLAIGEAAVTLLVLPVMVVVAKLALTGIGQIGWAGLNRLLAAFWCRGPSGTSQTLNVARRRRAGEHSPHLAMRLARSPVQGWDFDRVVAFVAGPEHRQTSA